MKKLCIFTLLFLFTFPLSSQSILALDSFASIINTKPIRFEEIPNENPRVDAAIYVLQYADYSNNPIYYITLFSPNGKTEYYLSDFTQHTILIDKKSYFYKQPYKVEEAEVHNYLLLLNSEGLFQKTEEEKLAAIKNITDIPAIIDFKSYDFMFDFLQENLDIFYE